MAKEEVAQWAVGYGCSSSCKLFQLFLRQLSAMCHHRLVTATARNVTKKQRRIPNRETRAQSTSLELFAGTMLHRGEEVGDRLACRDGHTQRRAAEDASHTLEVSSPAS
jgi:hypothetical protein